MAIVLVSSIVIIVPVSSVMWDNGGRNDENSRSRSSCVKLHDDGDYDKCVTSYDCTTTKSLTIGY